MTNKPDRPDPPLLITAMQIASNAGYAPVCLVTANLDNLVLHQALRATNTNPFAKKGEDSQVDVYPHAAA